MQKVRTRELELWREGKMFWVEMGKDKDVGKARSTVQSITKRFKDRPTVETKSKSDRL